MDGTFRKGGIYRRRWQWWFPWSLTDWWRPCVFTGADEWCDESACFVLPPLGCLVLFWRPGRLRTLPCAEEWAEMDEEHRADYAPCGYYHGGRVRRGGHLHWETGICKDAREWLASQPQPARS